MSNQAVSDTQGQQHAEFSVTESALSRQSNAEIKNTLIYTYFHSAACLDDAMLSQSQGKLYRCVFLASLRWVSAKITDFVVRCSATVQPAEGLQTFRRNWCLHLLGRILRQQVSPKHL
jgi:hypothetical protein